jgi:hypothetical protein
VTARLNDPYFYATGYPIAEAFWASVKIAGVPNTAVLVQPYERRVLTYVPTAPEGFKVQMGNIGLHYYAWRYQDAGQPVEPTPGAQPTPVLPPCSNVPVRGFGKVWADHPDLRIKLGCTYQSERPLTVTQQNFEHGQMIESNDPTGHNLLYMNNRTIYVLFEDGTVQGFPNNYVDGAAEPKIDPPTGLYTPTKAFGKLWREGTGARIRERLGWATAPQVEAKAPGAPGGAGLEFPSGAMIYSGPVTKKIYVVYRDTSDLTAQVIRWLMFDDTYSEP